MSERFNGLFRVVLLTSRWSMAPLALGLIFALLLVIVQFFRELAHAVTAFVEMGDGEVMIAILKLVDLALIANLVVMIVGAAVILFDPIFQGLAISLMAGEVASLLLSRMAVPVLYYMAKRHERHSLMTAAAAIEVAP